MKDLPALIERIQEIHDRLRHLSDSLPSAKGDAEAIQRIDTERAELHHELIQIGAEGMTQIDDPIVRNAVGKVIANMRAIVHPDEAEATTEPTPDPLEQARAVIDGHAQEIGRSTTRMMDEVMPMVEKALNHHTTPEPDADENEHAGIRVFAITIEMSEVDHSNTTGMIGLSISHLANFAGPDQLYEVIGNDDAIDELAKVLNYKLHALAIVTYGKGELRTDDDDNEPRPIECKVTTIIHPTGMIAYLRERIGNTYGEPDTPMVIVDDASEPEQISGILDKHGRLPYALAYLYAHTMKKIDQHQEPNT